jgi:L-cysteine desulfidase
MVLGSISGHGASKIFSKYFCFVAASDRSVLTLTPPVMQATGQLSQYVTNSLSPLVDRLPTIAKSNERLVSSALFSKYQPIRSQECVWVKAVSASRA